ncbi:hypothetical protein B0H13DRAFT_2343260 [Mycena leptocephala]|nr:hypothetical protein B0H13DRAFT_2343260 [Mycena leptocephala]
MSAPNFDVGQLTIPMFIGTLLNWALLGALAVQFSFQTSCLSRLYAEILQTLSDTRNTIRTFGSGWGNFDILDEIGWAWFSVPVIGALVACVGQIFFAWRIHIISRSLVIPSLIAVITTFQLVTGIWTGVEIARAKRFSELKFDYFKPPVAWLSATAACDLIIVASTCFYLLKSRSTGFQRSTDHIVFRIIKVTVETGVFCAMFALADLALFVKYNGNNYHLAVCIELSKVYSNSIMIILNSRAHIGHAPPKDHGQPHSQSSGIVFGTAAGPTVSATLQESIFRSGSEKYEVGIAV